jgi:hypothetical protein
VVAVAASAAAAAVLAMSPVHRCPDSSADAIALVSILCLACFSKRMYVVVTVTCRPRADSGEDGEHLCIVATRKRQHCTLLESESAVLSSGSELSLDWRIAAEPPRAPLPVLTAKASQYRPLIHGHQS